MPPGGTVGGFTPTRAYANDLPGAAWWLPALPRLPMPAGPARDPVREGLGAECSPGSVAALAVGGGIVVALGLRDIRGLDRAPMQAV